MAGTIQFVLATILVGGILCFFTLLTCTPLITVTDGYLNQHWLACTASGVNADELSSMDAPTQSIVRLQEEQTAWILLSSFRANLATAVMAHGLALMAFFGVSMQQMAEQHFGEGADTLKSAATIGTWIITGLAYFFVFVFMVWGLPDLDGEFGNNNLDFNLNSCYDTNPWFSDYESRLRSSAWLMVFVLVLVNVVVVSLQAVVYSRSASQVKMACEAGEAGEA